MGRLVLGGCGCDDLGRDLPVQATSVRKRMQPMLFRMAYHLERNCEKISIGVLNP